MPTYSYGRILPYKDRILDYTKPVDLYRNLNRKGPWFSIRQCGKVVAHCLECCMMVEEYHINRKAQARILETKKREVHAWLKGYLHLMPDYYSTAITITYSPWSKLRDFHARLGEEVIPIAEGSKYIVLHGGRLYLNHNVDYEQPLFDIVSPGSTTTTIPPLHMRSWRATG